MKFRIQELKGFLSSITKHNVANIYIKSENLNLIINTLKHKNLSINKKDFINYKNNNKLIKKSTQKKYIKNTKMHLSQEVDTYFTIISPMIGTFYRSPAPNEDPFVKTNDKVKINQAVCIIEAMKLMNEIESEVDGRIVEILVQDGDIVDCGQALMRVKHE